MRLLKMEISGLPLFKDKLDIDFFAEIGYIVIAISHCKTTIFQEG